MSNKIYPGNESFTITLTVSSDSLAILSLHFKSCGQTFFDSYLSEVKMHRIPAGDVFPFDDSDAFWPPIDNYTNDGGPREV